MTIRSLLSTAVSISIILSGTSPAGAVTGRDGEVFFRYRDPVAARPAVPGENDTKSIAAFYVAGLGFEFEELLPLKPEWQNDDWRIVSGKLPDGIAFDPATRIFSGTPTKETRGGSVSLEGFDKTGNSVARARVTFDVVMLQGVPVPTTLYAHTGHFKVDELPVPPGMPEGVAIESWGKLLSLPDGIEAENRYVQGTPTKAGTYRLLITGKDYKGDVVATYFGKYVVEDGPTFPKIPDMVARLPQLEWGYGLNVDFGAPATFSVNYQVDPARAVRYYMERKAPSQPLPVGTSSNDKPLGLNISGWIDQPYQTATIRFKAVDSDGTTGYSNWFTFGSSDPSPGCNPFSDGTIPVITGIDTSIPVPAPFGAQGTLNYSLIEGRLPAGLALDAKTGIISGRAATAGDNQRVSIVVDVANGDNVVSSQECRYEFRVSPAGLGIADLTDPQARHVRTGSYFDGLVGVTGGIPDYNLAISDPATHPWLSLAAPTLNQPRVEISGQTAEKGGKTIGLTLSNGDGSRHKGSISLRVHDPLRFDEVRDIHVKRLAASQTWGAIPYDDETVIPDVSGGIMPKFAISNSAALPTGIRFTEDGHLTGSTKDAAGAYGPFTVTMTDFSGETAMSDEFSVVVDDRDPILITLNQEQKFNVEWDKAQTLDSFSVTQPSGAAGTEQTWMIASKDGSPVPSWLTISPSDGSLSAAAGIPFASRGTYGPFVATVTDADGSTASAEFDVTLRDWQAPTQITIADVSGSVSGSLTQETTTAIQFPDLKTLIDPMTVIGGIENVSFKSSSPAAPAGLAFDAAAGTFSGTPSEPFDGTVAIAYEDQRGRAGTLSVGLKVKPYPAATIASAWTLPRLADAGKLQPQISPAANGGYWSSASWSADSTRGTDVTSHGLSVDPATGAIRGSTDAAEGTVISNIVLKSTSIGANGEVLRNWTQPFSITVGAPAPIALSYSPTVSKYLLEQGTLALQGRDIAVPDVSGSYKAPLAWSVDAQSASTLAGAGLSVDPKNGLLTGTPTKLGRWTASVSVSDAEGRSSAPSTLQVLSTLSGSIRPGSPDPAYPEWEGWPSAWRAGSGRAKVLRVDEPFRTPAIPFSNAVASVVFNTTPYPAAAGTTFNAVTGEFVAGSRFLTGGIHNVTIDARDADDRTLGGDRIGIIFDVKEPLAISVSESQQNIASRQYSAEGADPINVSFGVTELNRIGSLDYSIEGALPGTAVIHDGKAYAWIDGSQPRTSASASDLPVDAIVFDRKSLTLRGIPSKAGNFTFRLVARDSHADSYLSDTASRIPNNTARSQEITIAVAPAAALALKSSENPKGLVVPGGNGLMSVKAENAAYGSGSTFTVSGTLPPGITYRTDGTGAYFSGKFSGTTGQMGVYKDIAVSAKDSLGRTASIPVSFNVFLSTDDIGLTVSDITTKIGHTVTMQAIADNHFGALRFYTYDLSGQLGSQLSLSQQTGLVSGTFTSTAEHTINLFVTDATNRVTSKPFKARVIPSLKVTVPAQITASQGQTVNRTVLTDYRLGSVVYEKVNAAAWPEGFDLNSATGAITSTIVTSRAATYPDLQIKATDTFQSGGTEQKDVQLSNRFSIVVSDIDALPVISDRPKTILGTAGAAIAPVLPTVVDDTYGRPWIYSGTTYTASHDLSQYGLTFDPATGRISGTPTAPFIIRDFTITVTSGRGDSDVTQPFWIGVAPKDAIVATAGQAAEFTAYVGEAYTQQAPSFDNVIGGLTYARSPESAYFSQSSGIYTQTEMLASQIGRFSTTITVTDEFGRTGSFPHTLIIARRPLEVTFAPKDFEAARGTQFTTDIRNLTTLKNGTVALLTYSLDTSDPLKRLPSGLTMSPSGVISGSVMDGQDDYTFVVVASYADTASGTTKSVSHAYKLKVTYQGAITYTKVSTGWNHACGVTSAGKVNCWGLNQNGQLGNGTTADSAVPIEVAGLSGVTDIFAGWSMTCAISGGGSYCWGANNYGQLGTGDRTDRYAPAAVSGMGSGVSTMFVNNDTADPGRPHACAVKSGALYCWGSDSYGVLGNGPAGDSAAPTLVQGMESGVVSVGGGYIQTYAAKSDGTYWGWGWGGENRLGYSYSYSIIDKPVLIPLVTNVKKALNMMALTNDGRIVNPVGNLFKTNVSDMGAAQSRFCYIGSDGSAHCTNYGHFACSGGQCGIDNSPSVPGTLGLRAIDTGSDFACGINSGGYAVCWGQNTYGQLGDGTKTGRGEAKPVM